MLVVVNGVPVLPANVAELVGAKTSHVVAPLVLLNHHPALPAPPVPQVVHQKVYLVLVALPRVNSHQTPPAKGSTAVRTLHGTFSLASFWHLVLTSFWHDQTVAALLRTHPDAAVGKSPVKVQYLSVPVLNVKRKPFEELSLNFKRLVAVLVRTDYFLKLTDDVDCVLVNAGLAVVVLVNA